MKKILALSFLFSCFFSSETRSQDKEIDSLTTLLPTVEDTAQVHVLISLAVKYRFKDREQSLKYAERALLQSRNIKFRRGEMLALQKIAIGLRANDEYSLSLEKYLSALKIAEEIGDWGVAAMTADHISSAYVALNDYGLALTYQKQALQYSFKAPEPRLTGLMLSGVGHIHLKRKEFDSAVHYLKRAFDLFNELKDERGIAQQNIHLGMTYEELGQYDAALKYYDAALNFYRKINTKTGQALVLNYQASVYLKQNNAAEAIRILELAKKMNKEVYVQFHMVETLKLLGKAYLQGKNYDSAASVLNHLIVIAKSSKLRSELRDAYHVLSNVAASQKDFKNAFNYNQLHARYADSVFSEEKNKQLHELQLRVARESQDKEMNLLKHEKFLSQIYLIVALVGAAIVIILGYLIIVRQRLQAQRDKLLAEKEIQLMEEQQSVTEAEPRNKHLSEIQLKDQIEFKNKELTSYTLNLIHKNETLEDIKMQVESIRKAPDTEVSHKLNGLLKAVNYSIQLDKDWENFKRYFEQVHQQFFDKLKARYPDLSFNDLKLCSLVKLNLETKQIATLLDISTESAKVARSRLRKKLGLSTEQNLQDFLADF